MEKDLVIMHDLVIRGGTVVDGTGAPRRLADVAIDGQTITAVGVVLGQGRREIDATGHLVTPGWVDIHTHYDGQVSWDPFLSPSCWHGVTTVVMGNCGVGFAPVKPHFRDRLINIMEGVEDIPGTALTEGITWEWETYPEYLDALDGTLMPNAGFLVGHSALRRVVMHDAANQREATDEEIEAMCNLLRDGLRAGGMGFSSTWSPSHNDHTGVPVPSRHGSRKELIALCAVVEEFPGTTLEFIPAVGEFAQETFELMGDMSAAANRPLNWNLLQVYAQNWELVQHQLKGFDIAAERGGKVIALTLPDTFRIRLNFKSGFILDILNGWDELMALPDDVKLTMMRDPKGREEMNRLAQSTQGPTRSIGNWGA
jgi:N-acyl-D-aspartate/D-glutamate deacylase